MNPPKIPPRPLRPPPALQRPKPEAATQAQETLRQPMPEQKATQATEGIPAPEKAPAQEPTRPAAKSNGLGRLRQSSFRGEGTQPAPEGQEQGAWLYVADTETVPDPAAAPKEWDGKSMLKPAFQQVVSISRVLARIGRDEDGGETYTVTSIGPAGPTGPEEKPLLKSFWREFETLKPRMVTWGGRGYDIPLLRWRSMVHGLTARHWHRAGDKWNSYQQRYAPEWHCDVMDVLSDHNASSFVSLNDACRTLGFPSKINGHGSDVAAMAAEGHWDEIEAYCDLDCVDTFLLFLRVAAVSGRCSPKAHDMAVDSLVAALEAGSAAKPSYATFLEAWRSSRRPAPFHIAED